jgi:outer membrane protein OmpA-like peptidoglycan-associated protein
MLIRYFIFIILCFTLSSCASSLLQPEADDLNNHLQNTPAKVLTEKENIKIIIPAHIGFAHKSAHLNSHAYPILDAVINTLNNYPDTLVKIIGYTTNQGRERADIILSEKRAKEIAYYFVRHHIHLRRIETLGFSAENSTASNNTLTERLQNQRMEIVVYKPNHPAFKRAP